MIFNLRGTHGSGKSTVAKKLMELLPWEPLNEQGEIIFNGARPRNYVIQLKPRKLLYIIGSYTTACGGCDGIQPYDLIWPRVENFAVSGHVFFEGALVSSSVGNIGRAMAARKDCIVGFMDTPLKECLARIQKRRLAKGDTRPLNPKNTEVKFNSILRSRPQIEVLGLRCATIHYKKAVSEVLAILKEAK